MGSANMFFVGAILVLLAVIVAADHRYPVLRDIKTTGQSGRGSYSLGRVQMAFWTVLILAALVKLAALNGATTDVLVFDKKLLVLLGISGVTGLAAMSVDVQKDKDVAAAAATKDAAGLAIRQISTSIAQLQGAGAAAIGAADALSELQAELAAKELQRQQAEVVIARATRTGKAEGFFKDILEDENGNSLHRLQMVFFTLLTGILFFTGAIAIAAAKDPLPNIPEELLQLMGISGGLYVGFKIPGKSS